MNRQGKKIGTLTSIIALSLLSSPLGLTAEDGSTILVGEEFASTFKFLIVFLFIVLAITAGVAFLIKGKSDELLGKLRGTVTDDGRDVASGKKESWRILMVGGLLILGVFVVSFNPFVPVNPLANGPLVEAEDWTEPGDTEVVFWTAAEDIEQGKEVFVNKCAACHGQSGEGLVGPNLLDEYWKNGGSPLEIFTTITAGVPKTSMVPWKKQLTPKKRLQVMGYLNSMKGQVEGKEAEGEKYVAEGIEENAEAEVVDAENEDIEEDIDTEEGDEQILEND